MLTIPARRASAEAFIDLCLGKSYPANSDIRIRQPNLGNDLCAHDVSFADRSASPPLWYSIRAGGFLRGRPRLGFALELIHPKLYARTGETKRVTGTRAGVPVDREVRLDAYIQRFDISHGINLLAGEVLFRGTVLPGSPLSHAGRIEIYGGAGAGPVITHAENRIDGVENRQRYEIAALGYLAFAGMRAMVGPRAGIVAEYKGTLSDPEVGIASGTGRIAERTHHLAAGLTVRIGRP